MPIAEGILDTSNTAIIVGVMSTCLDSLGILVVFIILMLTNKFGAICTNTYRTGSIKYGSGTDKEVSQGKITVDTLVIFFVKNLYITIAAGI